MIKPIDFRKKGKLIISNDIMEQHNDAMFLLLSKVIPIHIENIYWENKYVMIAVSNEFDVVNEGEAVPEYSCEITERKDEFNEPFYLIRFIKEKQMSSEELLASLRKHFNVKTE